ncbi:type IV pilin [Halobacterium litoreum]|uniref:Type IV pilin n=1 Tax=Halobacterium litoreum TaxID=2039234 RepID=A0ABD5NE38_9EURY|nr:type IV pilin [Halobacterium litoreum]UHH13532.1 type IV pilin [Halobacterium litoreum]
MARGYAPVAVVLLLAVTVVAAASVLTILPSVTERPPADQRGVAVDATADGRVTLTLVAGPELDVRDVDVAISVDGAALDHQPPVPFFSATGFVSGPTGPFNVADDPTWRVGESASVRIAGTNAPTVEAGDAVEVRLVVRGTVVATARTEVTEGTA